MTPKTQTGPLTSRGTNNLYALFHISFQFSLSLKPKLSPVSTVLHSSPKQGNVKVGYEAQNR